MLPSTILWHTKLWRRCLIALAMILCAPSGVYAVLITDYTMFSVGNAPNSTTTGAIYGYTTLGGAPQYLGNLPTGFQGNGLASDPSQNRLLWIVNGQSDSDGDDLYEFDLTTLTSNNLGNVDSGLDIEVRNTTGGGAFYNGSYYYWDDDNADGQGLIQVEFDGSGAIADRTLVYEGSRGQFGDFVINQVTGVMYGVSDRNNDGDMDFWSMSMSSPGTFTNILDNVAYQQIAFDNTGNMIAVEATGATRLWYDVDPTNGSSTTSTRIVYTPSTADQSSFDLSNGGLYIVPEPSTYVMVGLGLAGFVWHRRRRSAAKKADAQAAA